MTKSDLVDALSKKLDITQKAAGEIVDAVFDSMKQAALRSERIEIRGFGTFTVREYDSRTARNPRTNETFTVPASKSLKFKYSKKLAEKLNEEKSDT